MHPRCKAIENILRQYLNHSLIVQVRIYQLEILLQLLMVKCLAVQWISYARLPTPPPVPIQRCVFVDAKLHFYWLASTCFILIIRTSSSSHHKPNYTPQKQNPLHVLVRDLAHVHWNIHHKDNEWDIIPVDELKGQLLELQGGEGAFCFLVTMFNVK